MLKVTSSEWNEWIKWYKICYYPYFLYSLPIYEKSSFDKYIIEEEVSKHLKRFKTLLLYFDYVSIPLSTLIKPRNIYAKNIFKALLRNEEFISLYENHLIISTLYKNEDPYLTFEVREEYLNHIQWKTKTDFYKSIIKEELSKFLVYEVDVNMQVNILQTEILRNICDQENPEIQKKLYKLVKDAEKNPKFPFSHEKFSQLIYNTKDQQLIDFLSSSNLAYFEASELGNPGSAMPYIKTSDRINRKSTNTYVYSILYDPDFFINFLSNFIEPDLLMYISKLPVTEIQEFRNLSFWREYVSKYHKQLEELSEDLNNTPAEDLIAKAKYILIRKIYPHKLTFLYEGLLIALNLIPFFKHLDKSKTFKDKIEQTRKFAALKLSNKEFLDFILTLQEKLKKSSRKTTAH